MIHQGKESDSKVHRIDGRLHFVHHVADDKGKRLATVTGPLKEEFRLEVLAQLVAGACVMALPVALTGECCSCSFSTRPPCAI